jgi:serine/threonine protein kinase
MGQVYRAYDTQLHRPVAVKLLATALTADPAKKQRLLQEARAAARVTHPAIAQIYYADEEEGVTFIVMELVEGKTVRELVQNHELDVLGAMDIALQVAEGLAQAHERGIIHRDIKPANVMVTASGQVKVLDFGLAKVLVPASAPGPAGTQPITASDTSLTQPGVVMGTPAYMSPEQVRGLPVDLRADLFSLGVLLYEMVTGHSPFRRDNLVDSLHAVAFDETPSMDTPQAVIPAGLQRIVARCLKKRPEERYLNARALADDLRVVRRQTEAGVAPKTSWRQRWTETWDSLLQLPPSRYAWYSLALISAGSALYFSIAKLGLGAFCFLLVVVAAVYRHFRTLPLRLEERFVRRVAKIPEVRLVSIHGVLATVVVDRPVAQLYGRINGHVQTHNRKLYWGQPMTVSILHDLSSEQFDRVLTAPGVRYVRKDAVGSPSGAPGGKP